MLFVESVPGMVGLHVAVVHEHKAWNEWQPLPTSPADILLHSFPWPRSSVYLCLCLSLDLSVFASVCGLCLWMSFSHVHSSSLVSRLGFTALLSPAPQGSHEQQ